LDPCGTQHNQDGDLWVIIDAKVYDLTKFAAIHPGGRAVLLADDVREYAHVPFSALPIEITKGGQDVTELFYSLHKSEVLLRPQYARLQKGIVKGQEEQFAPLPHGSLSPIPYGGGDQFLCFGNLLLRLCALEPQWLSKGFSSPYYGDVSNR
jgi:Cytochrome b5-like Heme/Steroid binding domain